jgi:hypothetical protein
MSIILGNATVPSSSTVAAFRLPPGYSNMTLYQPATPQPVYIGTSNTVAATNGMPVPNTPLNQETYTGSAGATIWATTGNATASSFSYIISTT